MHRNYQPEYDLFQNIHALTRQTAFHEAGHAASIYIGNKQKQLPPVFFKIQVSSSSCIDNQLFAKVIDGHLIQDLPHTELELSKEEQLSYQKAYEADVVNLLVGPLAEAKYISIRDNEIFDFRLLNAQSLNYYGGSSDLEKAYTYLECFIPSEVECEEKMLELFYQAFQFVQKRENWTCILNLAHYILDSDKEIISCEEAIEVFDAHLLNG